MALILGIDEAGRGPVVGPLVIAGTAFEEPFEEELLDLGIKDSKLILPAKRQLLFNKITKIAKAYEIVIVPATEIDDLMSKMTLNDIEALKIAEIIVKIKPDTVILDSPHPIPIKFIPQVRKFLPEDFKVNIISENKADLNYKSVAAASILAKVTRDAEIKKIQELIGEDFGSGYPSDPKTISFLKDHTTNHTKYLRTCWAPYKKVIATRAMHKLDEFY